MDEFMLVCMDELVGELMDGSVEKGRGIEQKVGRGVWINIKRKNANLEGFFVYD